MAEDTERKPKGCLLALLGLLGGASPDREESEALPYEKQDYLLSKAERSFFGVLERVTRGKYLVFAKVRLADVVLVPSDTPSRQSHFNRIQSKHVDFLICDMAEVRPLLAIELDDSSHQKDRRKTRDAFVESALEAAGLPLLRVPVQKAYSAEEIGEAVMARLDG